MKIPFRVQLIAGAAALVTVGYLGGAVANAESTAPSRDDALAAVQHAQQDLDLARRYLESQGGSPQPSASSSSPAASRASGMPWSSGAFTMHSASKASEFGSWRNGHRIDNVSVAPTRDSWSELLNPWWQKSLPTGFDPAVDDLIVALPLFPGDGKLTGNYDSQWGQLADQIKATDPDAYVRIGWEMNLPDWPWKLTADNRSAWAAAFNRAAVAIKNRCPKCRIVFNPNRGGDHNDGDTRAAFQDVKANVDVYALDSYDEWDPDTSDSSWVKSHRDGKYNLQESYEYAVANGKKFAVPEWGIGCTGNSECQWDGHAGGDNPRYINDYMDWFNSVRSGLAFESYFNETGKYIKSNLYPADTNPKAAAAYRSKVAQYDAW